MLYAALTNLNGLERDTFEGDKKHESLNWSNVGQETTDKMTNKVLELLQTRQDFVGLSFEGQLAAWRKPVDREELEAWKATRLIPEQSENDERKA